MNPWEDTSTPSDNDVPPWCDDESRATSGIDEDARRWTEGQLNGEDIKAYTGRRAREEKAKADARTQQSTQSDAGNKDWAKLQDTEWGEPEPLLREAEDAAPFPLEALPTVARKAAHAMAEAFEASPTIAGQCVLAAIVAACQAHADVHNPATGAVKPTSQKFLVVARSGDRKTTCDDVAFKAFETFEAELDEKAATQGRDFAADQETFERMKRNIGTKKADTKQDIRAALLALGDPPRRPPGPKMLCTDPTFEGLVKQLHEEQPDSPLFLLIRFADNHLQSYGGAKSSCIGRRE